MIANQIMEIVNNIKAGMIDIAEYGEVGIRIDDAEYNIGDIIPPSRDWDDGEPVGNLNGTSVYSLDFDSSVYKTWADAAAGKYAYVVYADNNDGDGDDMFERILIDPKVIAKIILK
jgi:hypothetical protein